jgi:hypothetical protein
MHSLTPLRAGLAACPVLVASLAWAGAPDVGPLLEPLRAVRGEGGGSPAARAAWDRLVKVGPAVLPRLLEAMDTPDTVAANWLRTAFDRIAEAELKRGGKGIDSATLLAFAQDARHQGRARRLALDVVEQVQPGTRDRLLPGWVDDPEFGHDAIDRELKRLARVTDLPKEQRLDLYRKLFRATREVEQARTVAVRLGELGEIAPVADHFGFLREWYVLGPFDADGQKGFKTVYPPEKKVDLAAEHAGKHKKSLPWKRLSVPDPPGGRLGVTDLRVPLGEAEDAVGYAYAVVELPEAREVEFRGAADDNFSVWVNGERVFGFEEYRNGIRMDRHRFKVPLRAGPNAILVKVCQGSGDPGSPDSTWEFLLRICDVSGKGVPFKNALPSIKGP